MSDFNFTAAAVAVTNHERKSGRMQATYDGLAAHYGLSLDTESADMTAAAREIVLTGANHDDTAAGRNLTADDLTGRDPGADAGAVRAYWKAARAVRIGLVLAVKRAAGETDDDETGTVNILTAAGVKALAEMSDSDLLAAVKAEMSARQK